MLRRARCLDAFDSQGPLSAPDINRIDQALYFKDIGK